MLCFSSFACRSHLFISKRRKEHIQRLIAIRLQVRWCRDANFSARFLRGFMGFLLQRGIFFKNLPNLYINISKNRVIQLYSYTTYFIYLLLFLGVCIDSYM